MRLVEWNQLPKKLQTNSVKPYYNVLRKKRVQLAVKRIFDVVASVILLMLLFIPFIILAIWIKCDSKGPVFFRQIRVTQYGKTFRIYKFRTMVQDAEKKGAQVTTEKDVRVTKVGSKLRGSRLDELPQVINILLGDMSFVGTRPEVSRYVKEYKEEMYATLLMPAGVTSRASIEYKDEAELLSKGNEDKIYIETVLPAKMEYNLRELKDFSLWQDIKTMCATIKAVL